MVATQVVVDTIPSIDPATGQVRAQFEKTPPLAVAGLMARARAAQVQWANRPIKERCALIGKLKKTMLEARETLADAVVRESGKPRVEALFADVFVSLDTAEYFAKQGRKLLRAEKVKHHSTAAKAKSGTLLYEPLGVVGIISSWNYPLAIPMSQIVPALAAGNGVLCKTSDFTPGCGALSG
ncbi:MAG: aldehyde dehydrogenase family protein, partial [Candidatus Acidiferrum sp.]